MQRPTIYLVRHGQTLLNAENRLQGCGCDAPLTALGRAQSERVAAILRQQLPMDSSIRVVSSPLGRALATASIILRAFERRPESCEIDGRLREIDFGDWTALPIDTVRGIDANLWTAREADPWTVKPPHGECYADVAARALSWFNAQRKDTIAVSHGVFGRVLRGTLLGLSGNAIRHLDEPHDGVFRLVGTTIDALTLDVS